MDFLDKIKTAGSANPRDQNLFQIDLSVEEDRRTDMTDAIPLSKKYEKNSSDWQNTKQDLLK